MNVQSIVHVNAQLRALMQIYAKNESKNYSQHSPMYAQEVWGYLLVRFLILMILFVNTQVRLCHVKKENEGDNKLKVWELRTCIVFRKVKR